MFGVTVKLSAEMKSVLVYFDTARYPDLFPRAVPVEAVLSLATTSPKSTHLLPLINSVQWNFDAPLDDLIPPTSDGIDIISCIDSLRRRFDTMCRRLSEFQEMRGRGWEVDYDPMGANARDVVLIQVGEVIFAFKIDESKYPVYNMNNNSGNGKKVETDGEAMLELISYQPDPTGFEHELKVKPDIMLVKILICMCVCVEESEE